jgi:hypothetical protein
MSKANRTKTPVAKVSGPSLTPTISYLDTYIKPFVDPDIYFKYHALIERLEHRGPKIPQIRKEYRQLLKKLVEGDEDLKDMHNDCAKLHNKRNAGKHTRYHFPVFDEEEEKVDEVARGDTVLQEEEVEEEDSITEQDAVMVEDEVVEEKEDDAADEVATPVEQINDTIVLPATEPERRFPVSALSYLAWLRKRKVRFPNAFPRHAECIVLGEHFGRPARMVYDEILFHWGLETDSKFGKWHREHRLVVLGEDPLFE